MLHYVTTLRRDLATPWGIYAAGLPVRVVWHRGRLVIDLDQGFNLAGADHLWPVSRSHVAYRWAG